MFLLVLGCVIKVVGVCGVGWVGFVVECLCGVCGVLKCRLVFEFRYLNKRIAFKDVCLLLKFSLTSC